MKKFTAFLLTAALLIASSTPILAASSTLDKAYGWYETIHLEWSNDSSPDNAKVEYKLSSNSSYTAIDEELIRANGSGCVADIVGIASGIYDIKVTTSDGDVLSKNNISVARHDRSGYAHFGLSTGLGGYNNDGTPKSDAQIVYVTNENKNSVSLGSYTGIGKILPNAKNFSTPIIVRIIGKVDTQTRDSDGTKTTDINNGVVAINGLTDKTMTDDSYFNMMDVSSAKNITIEGIGSDAVIEKWGFTFSKCNSIEVRNLTFLKYPEDACSFEGSSSSNSSYKNFWVHNNYFLSGENKYDLTSEQDKGDGDGSSDFKGCRNITYSYNVFENCHKTSLHGGSDGSLQYNSTWHHNYFVECSSRLPLTRQVNLHTYNNYYYKCSKATDSRASAWVFAECNYYKNGKGILTTKSSSYGDPIVKLYNNIFDGSTTSDSASTIVTTTDRTLTISASKGTNKNVNPYPNFDTDSSVFYYDSENKVSDVEYLTDASTALNDSVKAAGVSGESKTLEAYLPTASDDDNNDDNDDPVEPDKPAYITYVGNEVSFGSGTSTSLKPSNITAGDYTSNFTSGIFTLVAGSSKKISVSSTQIDLGGGGTTSSARNINFPVTGSATITVKYFNNGSSERTLALSNEDGSFYTEKAAPKSGSASNTQTLTASVSNAGTYYVYSTSGGIKITEITITYASEAYKIGDVDLDGDIDNADAACLLKAVISTAALNEEQQTLADCDKNNNFDLADVLAILNYI